MSDAFTDIVRDQERAGCYSRYLGAVRAFLSHPTKKNRKAAIAAASKTDGVAGGYFGGRTRIAGGVEEMLDRLKSNDRQTWVEFLC